MKKLFSLTIAIFFASVLFGQTASVIYSFSGDASDISGNGNDGTLSAGTSAIKALKIANSVNNYLIVPADVLDGIADLSINFKIKFTGFHTTGLSPTNQIFSGSRSGCVQCFGFSYEKGMNSWRLAFNGTTLNWADESLLAKKWYCMSIVKEGSNITLYKNGISLGTQTLVSTIDITSFVIGQEDDCTGGCFAANQSMWGHMDNFQVWNGVKVDCGININGFRSEETEENINEEISDNFTIFPNPATILINFDIHNDTNQNYRIKILDMLGKEIYAQPEVTNSIDISSLTNGVYIVLIENIATGEFVTKNFIKE